VYRLIYGKKEANALRFKAYKAIKEKIIYLELRPGEKIFENALADSLNVSRTPVREALLMLEHEKLVVCTDSLGFIVRRFSTKDIEEYYALRYAIEEFVISLVVDKITEEEIAALQANVTEGEEIIAGATYGPSSAVNGVPRDALPGGKVGGSL